MYCAQTTGKSTAVAPPTPAATPMLPPKLPPKPVSHVTPATPMLPPKLPPKPVSQVTPATSGSEGVYMPLRMTGSRQQEEDHYMSLCDTTRERSHIDHVAS